MKPCGVLGHVRLMAALAARMEQRKFVRRTAKSHELPLKWDCALSCAW
jgi:hypothetical protein